jgi:hypothetical protein
MVLEVSPELHSVHANAWFVRMPGHVTGAPSWIRQIGPGSLELRIADSLERLERQLGRPKANAKLPVDLRLREVQGWLRLREEVEAIRTSTWVLAESQLLESRLRVLAEGIDSR